MDTLVIAGGIPNPEDPLYAFTQGEPKALLDIAGKPMIQWVLDALSGAESVGDVVIIGLPEDSGLTCPKVKAYLPNQGGMVDNIRAGVLKVKEINPFARHVLISSSDIPGIRPEIADWVVNTAMQTDDDIYYTIVERTTMESRYPGSNRSYVQLKDIEVCGGDINVIRASIVTQKTEFWEKLVAARKNALKQAALIGFDTLLLLLLGWITLDGAVKKVVGKLKLSGRPLVCPYAEAAMDVDKPHQLEIMRRDLEQRNRG